MTPVITRAQWGARYSDGSGPAPLPAAEWWLHHSATIAPDLGWLDANGDGVDDDERAALRTLEAIGQERFRQGMSYTFLVVPSGRLYVGHTMGRLGAHTAGHNTRGRGICLVGNYDQHAPTAEQLLTVAQLLVDEHRAGRASTHRLSGGHRDVKATECPGDLAYALIPEINRLAAALWAGDPATPTPGGTAVAVTRTLRITTPLMRGPDVVEAQRATGAKPDGVYGEDSAAAVRRWQAARGLAADGIVGPATWRAIREGMPARPTSPPPPPPAPAPAAAPSAADVAAAVWAHPSAVAVLAAITRVTP